MSLLLLVPLLAPAPAAAVPDCPTHAHRAELSEFTDRIRGADTPEEARDLALRNVRASRRAVDRALRLAPRDPELLEHRTAFEEFEDDVKAATSQEQVANRFAALQATRAVKCHYSPGEVIAVVIGFILGVIPGIILLILLC